MFLAIGASAQTSPCASAVPYGNNAAAGHFATVNGVRLGLIRSGGRISYAACAARRSNAAGLTCPSVECRRRWL